MEINYTITEIENLTEFEAAEMARCSREINGHTVYFVDFPEPWGYSCLVFAEGKHIHYANDYGMHHNGKYHHTSKSNLYKWYLETLNQKLYTEEQLLEPIKDYDDARDRRLFLSSYYAMRRDSVSAFTIITTSKAEKEFEKKIEGKMYNPVCYGYYDDREFVGKCLKLFSEIVKREEEMESSFDYWKQAFKYEMANHEYIINTYQGNWDVLSCFGNIEYNHDDDPEDYMNQLKFNDTQRKAWVAARREYMKEAEQYL